MTINCKVSDREIRIETTRKLTIRKGDLKFLTHIMRKEALRNLTLI